jgi:hypothetical protein
MKTCLLTIAIGVVLCGTSSAATIFYDNASPGTWTAFTQQGAVVPTGLNTNFLSFGTPDPGPLNSGYEYVGAAPPPQGPLSTGVQFLVGTFTHHNQEITPGTSILDATLTIDLHLAIPGPGADTVVKAFSYLFQHDETDNAGNPCPYLPGNPVNDNGCADRVHIANSISPTDFFIGSTLYTLELIGFSQDGGATTSTTFITAEQANNTAQLFGVITEGFTGLDIPEPGTLVLCGIGIIALTRGLRRPSVR